MKLLDRMLIRGYFKTYLICFVSLVSLYVVIDLFSNLDEFAEGAQGLAAVLERMGTYYGYRLVLIFDRLSGVIVLLAALFTITWMQRHNELLPLLASGIPMRRVLWPLFLSTLATIGVGVANRELLMPRIAERLHHTADDPHGQKAKAVNGAYEPNGVLVTGYWAYPADRLVLQFSCTIPEKIAGRLHHLSAKQARYVPKSDAPHSGGWLMLEAEPPLLPGWTHPVLDNRAEGEYFLYTERVDFDLVTRPRTWYQFAGTRQIFNDLQAGEMVRQAAMAVQLHLRLTTPVLTLLMILMGLSLVLRDQSRNVFLNAGLCLVLAAIFYAAVYLCRHLGENEYLSPALAAWLPVLSFGPLAFTMFDAIHT